MSAQVGITATAAELADCRCNPTDRHNPPGTPKTGVKSALKTHIEEDATSLLHRQSKVGFAKAFRATDRF
jgi:hypothetical protein